MDFLETLCKQEISPIKRGFFSSTAEKKKKNQTQHVLALKDYPSCHTSPHTHSLQPPRWGLLYLVNRKKAGKHQIVVKPPNGAQLLYRTTAGGDWVGPWGWWAVTSNRIKVWDLKIFHTHVEWGSRRWENVHMHALYVILCMCTTSESTRVSFSSGVQTSEALFAVPWSLARSLI